ncbi:putative membrane protein [Saccharothrix espanaensis DSM 44229]|uniref:Putative membrane protein n=1 Tax=Saccharothrix espanaensis (strain ATCC 51144 / DSM 44229 / JCM 9112 / NBRC 15066 / NRRL 15764) TaxID=1179773 RepID=K0K0Q3_SACES|nr:putative membrane protein [Saccharothrix espanaensis DSM 44229]
MMGYSSQVSESEQSDQRRLARNFNELLQELRVAQAGVQILFGFLLSIAFTDRYAAADSYVRVTHMITILFSAGAVALLTAPAAWHRILFRKGRREDIIDVANRFAIGGLACLAVAMTGTILLLGEVVVGGWAAIVLGAVAAVFFASLWFLLPWRERGVDTVDSDDGPA